MTGPREPRGEPESKGEGPTGAASRARPGAMASRPPKGRLAFSLAGRARGISSPLLVGLGLGLALLLRVGFLLRAPFDPDESQHLQAAWLVSRGQVPYRDFWEHHAPGFYDLLVPLLAAVPEGPEVYFLARGAMLVLGLVALGGVWALGRTLSPRAGLLGAGLLAVQPRVIEKTVEVRPDVAALLAWVGVLLALARWRREGRRRWVLGAGVALGLAGALNLKAVLGAAGVGLLVLLTPAVPWPRRAADLGLLALGATATTGAWLGVLTLRGGGAAFRGFLEHAVGGSLAFADPTRELPVSEEGLGFVALALAGVAVAIRVHGRTVVGHPVHGPLLVPSAVAATALLLPATPAVYRHAWLPILVAVAPYAGLALDAALRQVASWPGRAGPVLAAGLLAASLAGPVGVSAAVALRDGNGSQVATMRAVLARTCPDQAVLDGMGLAVFRPAAHRYRVLVKGVRLWVARGRVSEETLVADVVRNRPPVAIPDWRLRAMIGPLAAFLARHYVPTPDGLLVVGARIPVNGDPRGGRVHLDLLVSGAYRLETTPGLAVELDGHPAGPGFVRLEAGRHEVSWTGPPGMIRLEAAPCVRGAAKPPMPRGG